LRGSISNMPATHSLLLRSKRIPSRRIGTASASKPPTRRCLCRSDGEAQALPGEAFAVRRRLHPALKTFPPRLAPVIKAVGRLRARQLLSFELFCYISDSALKKFKP
jgi:hypothetical protein